MYSRHISTHTHTHTHTYTRTHTHTHAHTRTHTHTLILILLSQIHSAIDWTHTHYPNLIRHPPHIQTIQLRYSGHISSAGTKGWSWLFRMLNTQSTVKVTWKVKQVGWVVWKQKNNCSILDLWCPHPPPLPHAYYHPPTTTTKSTNLRTYLHQP